MFETLEQIEKEIRNVPSARDVDKCQKDNLFRISTHAEFPNTEYFDIFLTSKENGFVLLDCEAVYDYFRQQGKDFFSYWNEDNAEMIKATTGVSFTPLGMELVETDDKELGTAIMRFVQAFDLAWWFLSANEAKQTSQ